MLLPKGELISGASTPGVVVVKAAEAIPRADRIVLELVSLARLTPVGPVEHVFKRTIELEPPQRFLAEGTHRIPFLLELPTWLPPSFTSPTAEVTHTLRARIDVDWAADPTAELRVKVQMRPRAGSREPASLVLPPDFHAHGLVDLALDSTVLLEGEPVHGHVHLRRGVLAPFEMVRVLLVAIVESRRVGTWTGIVSTYGIPTSLLAPGEPVSFELPAPTNASFQTGMLDVRYAVVLILGSDFTPVIDRRAMLPLVVLPAGSSLHGERRGRARAEAMARATGLREGRGTTLLEGEVGGIRLRIDDERGGLDIALTYPDLGLGLTEREPGPFGDVIRAWREAARIRLSDHELGLEVAPVTDDRAVVAAEAVVKLARRLGAGIAALAFPSDLASVAEAWSRAARETSAFLVPAVPSLSGMAFHRVAPGQSERVFAASLVTLGEVGARTSRVYLYCLGFALPERTLVPLVNGEYPAMLEKHRGVLAAMTASSSGEVLTIDLSSFCLDPRTLLDPLEAVVDWILDERGERSSSMPYR